MSCAPSLAPEIRRRYPPVWECLTAATQIRLPVESDCSDRVSARDDGDHSDSGAVYGLYVRRDAFHAVLRAAIEKARDLIVLPAPTLGEIDYLLCVRLGNAALLRFLTEIQEGAFVIETVTMADLRRCAALIETYGDLDLGLSDASVVAVAERVGTNRILTVDQRDFRVIRSARGKPFHLLPADWQK